MVDRTGIQLVADFAPRDFLLRACHLTVRVDGRTTFFDIGANAGYFTLFGAKLVGEEGKVWSFEPVLNQKFS